jgi:predicted nucleic acid-binding protein
VDRVFLDANVLFSAAYLPESRLRELWALAAVELVTSEFALEEAQRNLLIYDPKAALSLERLRARLTVVPEASPSEGELGDINLPDKDRPILAAAIAANCTHLLTGDTQHFGALYGRTIGGVLVLTPGDYLRARRGSRKRNGR